MFKTSLRYLLLLSFVFSAIIALPQSIDENLEWQGIHTESVKGVQVNTLVFTGAGNDARWGLLPVFVRTENMPAPGYSIGFRVSDPEFAPLDYAQFVEDIDLVPERLSFETEVISIRGKKKLMFKMLPLRKNPETGEIEKLVSFRLNKNIESVPNLSQDASRHEYAENSVLAEGDWYKISVTKTGIYKVTWQDLRDLGMNMSEIPSERIGLYGNGGGMLPQLNADERDDDLTENAILVEDGGDGTFDQGDYFLFYGESPNSWEYVQADQVFVHSTNHFTDRNFYFVTIGTTPGKRVQNLSQSGQNAERIITSYNNYAAHELEERSLIHSGAEWYGEEFNDTTEQEFFFPFPNRDVTKEIYITGDFVARATSSSSFSVFINQDSVFTDNVSAIPQNSITKFGNPSTKSAWHMAPGQEDITLKLRYNRRDESSVGWLNYLEINVMSQLKFMGQQFGFRNVQAGDQNQNVEFRVDNTNENFRVWDVSDPHTAQEIQVTHSGTMVKFVLEMSQLREFVGFDGTDFMQPGLEGAVPNQNLHALQAADFIIVTHPDFADQAQRLKELHEEIDGMNVLVVDLFRIYNEFASGAPDVTAIRDFVRMIYQRSGTPPSLKYLLLFGDGSYDPLDRVEENISFIPTFQSKQSLWYTSTYVTDDYFGLMDDEEGKDASGNVDIGIGRFAVNSDEEAKLMVDKVEHYLRMSPANQGQWRNQLTFIADDEDNNLHLYQADTILIPRIQKKNSMVNISKIYFDAYRQESSASGQSFPQATADINSRINEGTLMVNYTGHGGELGLAHEKVVQISDILSWHNPDMLPVFVTATCEFSRFDNPQLTSAGELVLLNPNGGGIALFTTTRLAFASSNLLLNKRLYDTLFRAYPERHPRLGDLMMFSKVPSNTNIRNFVLLGDPALRLALPGYNIVTDSINGVPAGDFSDTLHANSRLEVTGHIESYHSAGTVMTDFNGTIFPVLYDKPSMVTTLGNDPKSYPYEFEAQNSVLYRGKASVDEGRFTFSLVLPRDISYRYGNGKLSYYAADSLTDAGGCFTDLMVGGINQDASADLSGPDIQLFINEIGPVKPEQVNPEPILYINLADPSGINATGNGIGHDITLTMNGSLTDAMVLNDLFEPSLDDYTSGSIVLPFDRLDNGEYTLQLKAWDMFNNSSVATIGFVVSDSINVDLMQVYNYPNPFSDHTWFTFSHNQFQGDLTVEIDIYNFYGQHVRTIGPEKVFTNGYAIEPIYWDGDTSGGEKLGKGVYFYTLRVTNEKNQSTERIQKMIITD